MYKEIRDRINAIPQASVQGPLNMIVDKLKEVEDQLMELIRPDEEGDEVKDGRRKTKGKSKQKVNNASKEAGEGS